MSIVAVLKTSPSRVLEDYARLIKLADFEAALPKAARTLLKLNLSWSLYFPACSTAPWQLEGVVRALRQEGYHELLAVENQTVVTDPWTGAYNNKWLPLLEQYGVGFKPLTDVQWRHYRPRGDMLAMGDLFEKILIPEIFFDANVVHLPTLKTHGHTVTTGAMKNAFGGLIPKYRHHAHLKIHQVLVDLLTLQKEIHRGVFAVIDGCLAGDGAGPRTMMPYPGNVIMASQDQVAVDAVAAKIMGFRPLEIPYIRMAHERGLGMGDLDQIEVVGMDRKELERLNFGFRSDRSLIIRWDQRLRKSTYGVPFLHRLLFHSPIFRAFILSSELYHDRFWYPMVGCRRMEMMSGNEWIALFNKYSYGKPPAQKAVREWDPY